MHVGVLYFSLTLNKVSIKPLSRQCREKIKNIELKTKNLKFQTTFTYKNIKLIYKRKIYYTYFFLLFLHFYLL